MMSDGFMFPGRWILRFVLTLMISESFFTVAYSQRTLLHLCSDGTVNRYEQAFREDFDKGIDREKWLTSYPWGRHLTGETESEESQEYYTDGNNLNIHDDIASFKTKKERTCGVCVPWKDSAAVLINGKANYRCFDYSSAMLYSKGDFSYGWYEVRFRSSANATGLWPAFWLFGDNNEIDIFENKGERNNETHWDLHCKNGCKGKKGGWVKVDADFSKNFNTISLQWHRNGMRWYLNGKNYKSTKQPFNSRMNIIINQAVSRSKEEKGFWVGPDNTTRFPATLEADFIYHYKNIYAGRIWKKKTMEEAIGFLRRDETPKGFSTRRVSSRSNQDIIVSLLFDAVKNSVLIASASSKTTDVFIYNESGKLLEKITLLPGTTKELKKLPAETLIITAKNGKYLLADRINSRR